MTRTIPDLPRKHGLSFGVDLQRLVADLLPREVTA